MATIKQLSGFAVLNINGGTRVSFTYDEIDGDTGNVITQNNKESFFVVDDKLGKNIDAIKEFIKQNKLEG